MEEREPKDIGWLKQAKAPVEGEELKAVIKAIQEPRVVKTQYGDRKMIQITLTCDKGELMATEYLGKAFPVIVPKSNIGKILKLYKCKNMAELLNKEVTIVMNTLGFWKIKRE